MFCTLKPHTCRLGCDRQHEYAAFYCGLCKSLGDHFGQLTRALLNYDAVFLALVADGLVEEGAEPDRCRCPMLPVTFRPTVRPDSPAMRYAAAMQMLLSDQWLADRAMDGKRAARAARPVLAGKVAAARAILGELGISLADLDGFEEHQHKTEIVGVTGPRDAAEPTASALERVFDRMALLPGVPAEARDGESRAALGAFGRHLGSAIYLIDALDDLEKDHRAGAFNPCLVREARGEGTRVSWPRVEIAWGALHDDLAALTDLVATLPLRRHRELVRSVVAVELPRLARAAAKRAHEYARAEDAREREAILARSPARRALAAVTTFFLLIWTWLSSTPAFAGPPKRPAATRDAGAGDAGARPPASWDPRLPAPRSSASAPSPASTGESGPTPAPSGSAAPNGKHGGEDPTTPGKPAPAGTATPGGGGGGCDNPCSGCSSGGKGSCPCSDCSNCCDVCKRCDCGKCCDGKDCGGCCKSCDACSSCGNCGNCGCK
jgi:hypothetical protein